MLMASQYRPYWILLKIHSALSVLPGILCLGHPWTLATGKLQWTGSGALSDMPGQVQVENVGSPPVGSTLQLKMFVAGNPWNQVKTKRKTAAFHSVFALLMLVEPSLKRQHASMDEQTDFSATFFFGAVDSLVGGSRVESAMEVSQVN